MTTPPGFNVWNTDIPLRQMDYSAKTYEPGQRHVIAQQQTPEDSLPPGIMYRLYEWLIEKYGSDITLGDALVSAVNEYGT